MNVRIKYLMLVPYGQQMSHFKLRSFWCNLWDALHISWDSLELLLEDLNLAFLLFVGMMILCWVKPHTNFKHSKYIDNGREDIAFSVHIGFGSSILIICHSCGSSFWQSFVYSQHHWLVWFPVRRVLYFVNPLFSWF